MIVQVINKDSYFNLFKSLFNECSLTTTLHSIEEETTSDRSARSEFFLSIIIDTIPFVGKTLYINKKEEFKDLLKEIDSLIASRSQSGGHSPLLDAFQFDSQDVLILLFIIKSFIIIYIYYYYYEDYYYYHNSNEYYFIIITIIIIIIM